jgi:ResB-like family protein
MKRIMVLLASCEWVVLAVLCVVGAFQGAGRATTLFNSPVLVAFWFLCLGTLLAGLVRFPRLLRNPGLLAMHVGPVLVLGGAMYGSAAGHIVIPRFVGATKIRSGYIKLSKGQAGNRVTGPRGLFVGRLDFDVRLRDFRVERYRDSRPWLLRLEMWPGVHRPVQGEAIPWSDEQSTAISPSGLMVTVLRYLPHARPTFDHEALLLITEANGRKVSLPVQPGRKVAVTDPPGELRIMETFVDLQVLGGAAAETSGNGWNPAVKVAFDQPGRQRTFRFAYARGPGGHPSGDGLTLRYVMPGPTGAEDDPDSPLPAMEVLVERKGKQLRGWLAPAHRDALAILPLDALFTEPESSASMQTSLRRQIAPRQLVLAPPLGAIKDFRSHLEVVQNGRVVEEKVIEVNDPLHYGGYHFYQHGYDDVNESFSVLSVRSDQGLRLALAGLGVLCAGAFLTCWVQPAFSAIIRGKRT